MNAQQAAWARAFGWPAHEIVIDDVTVDTSRLQKIQPTQETDDVSTESEYLPVLQPVRRTP